MKFVLAMLFNIVRFSSDFGVRIDNTYRFGIVDKYNDYDDFCRYD